jgi:chromosome segregation ATPase
MQSLTQLVYFDLPIPVWHIVAYVGCMSFLMIQRRFKLAIVVTFALVLFWFHYAFRANLVTLIDGNNVARAVYYAFGFALVLLSIYAFFLLEDEEAEFELEKRRKEIAGLRAKAREAKKKVSELKTQLKMDQPRGPASRDDIEEEIADKVNALERKLKESESVVEHRDAEIAELQARIQEAEENAAALKHQLERAEIQEPVVPNQLEEEFNSRVNALELKLKAGEGLLEQRDAAIAELQLKTRKAEEKAAAVAAQLETLNQETAIDGELEHELRGKIEALENQLKESEGLLAIRKAKMDELKAQARDAEKQAAGLKAQLEKDQTNQSAGKKKLETEFNAKIDKLQRQLKESASLLEKRDAEIAELHAKTRDAEKDASALKAQWEKNQSQESASRLKLEEELNAKINALELKLKDSDSLLEKRNAEVTELQDKTREAEENAAALKARLESDRAQESASQSEVEEQLKVQIENLDHQLKESASLLEKRNAEVAELQAETRQAEDNAADLKSQLAKNQAQGAASRETLEEELNAKINALELKLKDGDSLLEKRNAEVAELQAKAREAEENAAALKARLESDRAQESASQSEVEERLKAQIENLDHQLKESTSLAEKRNAEIAELQVKGKQAEERAAAATAQLEKDQSQKSAAMKKLEKEFNDNVANLESRLKESEALLAKRDAQIAEARAKAPAVDKKPAPSKLLAAANRPGAKTKGGDDKGEVEEDVRRKLHQFQYAVKYLEDQIKEKDRLLGLMAKKGVQPQGGASKNTTEDDLKKKVQQLDQTVKYLEAQNKEKDGLLGLMAKRNRELAEAKAKADEKLQMSGAENNGGQTAGGSQEP